MNQNRRKHKRFLISQHAQLVVNGAAKADCQISNYSEGGFYLVFDSAVLRTLRIGDQSAGDQSVPAEVLLEESPGAEVYRIPVRIAFQSDTGLGVAFINPDQQVKSYLSQRVLAEQQNSLSQNSAPASANTIQGISELESILKDFLASRFGELIEGLSETYLELEEQASQQDQPDLRYARSAVLAEAETLESRFFAQMANNWRQLQHPVSMDPPLRVENQSMELVDQEEFDEWAAVVSISRRLEGRNSNTLHKLSQSLAYLVRSPVSNDNNPLSPYRLLWSFKKSLDPIKVTVSARRVAYSVFAEQILANIDTLYHQIYQFLEQQDCVVTTKTKETRTDQAEQHEPENPDLNHRPKPRSLIETLSSYLGGKKRDARAEASAHKVSSNAAITNALDDMVQGDQRHLTDRIEQSLGGHAGNNGEVELSVESRQIIEATEQLLRMAQQDPRHNDVMCKILRQVQLPLAKAAIHNPAVLNDPSHSSRQLLDNLDQLALLTPAASDSVLAQSANDKLESVLKSLEAAGGKADLEEVSREVSDLLGERKSTFGSNLEQVLTSYATEQEASEASRQIRVFLEQELGGTIAVLIDQLLRLGWVGLLVQTAVLGDKKAKHLQGYKQVLVLLNQAFQSGSKQAYLKPEKWKKLEQVLHKGFDGYPLYREQSESLIEQIHQSLKRGSETFRLHNEQRVEITTAYLDQLLPDTAKAVANTDSDVDVEPQWVRQLEKIQVGDWVTEQQQKGRVRVLNLALHDAATNRYVFVDGSGIKALDCKQLEVLRRLQDGQISLIEDGGLSMVERAVERALKQSFERLREESDRDSVTGLPNRRAFMRELNRLLKSSMTTQSRHILICMDVDKFTLVNDLCGTEGGDHFLAKLAGICASFLSEHNSISRTGDNEFSVLLEQSTLDEGFRVAESLRKAIENYRFEWGGDQVSVTVSIGLAEVTSTSGPADDLNNAAHSACAEAKKEGRNRCRCYQQEGEVYTQRKRMAQSVPLIEQALEKDRLDLHAQLIQPVFIGDGLLEHHEVLLRRLDDQDKPSSPFEFIQAAEQYERMRAVDRWVVQRFFNWAKSELTDSRASELGAFSINLSGQSMCDATFPPFLKEQILNSPIPPELLAFEITETAMVSQMEQARVLMQEIKKLGCQFFLDDFGSGYASYSYLKEFPVDVVKIDGIFVKDIHQDEVSFAMVKSITEVAHHMDKLVVAEFVENEAILNALRKLEVDYAQGYCVGYPTELKQLFRSRSVA